MPARGQRKYFVSENDLYDLYWEERLSQTQISEKLGIPQVTVGRYLREYNMSDTNRRRDQRGELNTQYKNGMSRSTINRITKKLCEEYGVQLNRCQVCGDIWSGNLDRHHRDRNRANNTIENIIVICPSCHAKEHDRERARENGMYA